MDMLSKTISTKRAQLVAEAQTLCRNCQHEENTHNDYRGLTICEVIISAHHDGNRHLEETCKCPEYEHLTPLEMSEYIEANLCQMSA